MATYPRRLATMFATVDEQLAAWVEGTTRGKGHDAHVWFSRSGVDNCVPDFSCCRPSLEASEEVRRAFVTARPAIKHEFLAGFLMALLALDAPGKTEISRLPSAPPRTHP